MEPSMNIERAQSALHPPRGTRSAAGVAAVLLATLGWLTAGCTKTPEPAAAQEDSARLTVSFFKATVDRPLQPEVDALMSRFRAVPKSSPDWPTLAYLAGELHRSGNRPKEAKAEFRSLAVWAAGSPEKGPYGDGWGGSGLAAVALWRWLQLLNSADASPEEVDKVLEVARTLHRTRLVVGMFHSSLLPAIPLVEEESARLLSHVLWKAGRPEALAAFTSFLTIDSQGTREPIDDEIVAAMFARDLATPERLELFRFRRQLGYTTIEQVKAVAAERLHDLWRNERAPADVRAEAIYEWANHHRRSQQRKREVLDRLSDAYDLVGGKGRLAEKSLLLRGMVHNSVPPRDTESFFADLDRVSTLFPGSASAAEALYQMGMERLFGATADVEAGLAYLAALRGMANNHDRMDSAYFYPAIALVDRGGKPDLENADVLLAEYLDKMPNGPFRLRSIFWRGRIAEMEGREEEARRHFRSLVTQAPYDYHGLRASMHLDHGSDAIPMVLPPEGSPTWNRLRSAYRESRPDAALADDTPYHARLGAAMRTGLYAELLRISHEIGPRFRNRVDNIPPRVLDENRLMPAVAILLSLRQDAMAARDSRSSAENTLKLAAVMGRSAGDWPSAFLLWQLRQDAPADRVTALQRDPRYLATAFPPQDSVGALRGNTRAAAWSIDGSPSTSEALMYAMIRNESAFYAGALSSAGAIGLFQIMPRNFEQTPACQGTAVASAPPTAESRLFDAASNIRFWSCWTERERIRPARAAEIPQMLIKHHAGTGNLANWAKAWKGRRLEGDLELQIDTLRFPATQIYLRHVLADLAIAGNSVRPEPST